MIRHQQILSTALLVFVNFCPVLSEHVYKHFWYSGKNYQWKSNLGLTFPRFKFKLKLVSKLTNFIFNSCICIINAKNFHFWWKIFAFDQQYLNTSLKTQNGEKLSLDLIFITNFWQNIKSIFKQNSILRICSKATEFIQNRTEIDKIFQCAYYYYTNCTKSMICLHFYRVFHLDMIT